jgi:hypothetical protein
MSMDVLRGSDVISTGVTDGSGRLKVLFPDVYTEVNSSELYTFNLTKDGVPYSRVFSVEELLSLPREVNLLNVFGSGMMGFQEVVYGSLSFTLFCDFQSKSFAAVFEVKNSSGVIVYNGPSPISYIDTPTNDVSEMYTIKITYSWWNNLESTFISGYMKTANVSVSQLKNAPSPIIINQQYGYEEWWLFQ